MQACTWWNRFWCIVTLDNIAWVFGSSRWLTEQEARVTLRLGGDMERVPWYSHWVWSVPHDADRARPLWQTHSMPTEFFFLLKLGTAWQLLQTMKCHLAKKYQCYNCIAGVPCQQLKHSIYLITHLPQSGKTDIYWQLVYHICSDCITSEFHLQLAMKLGGLEGGQKSAFFTHSQSHFHLTHNWSGWLDFLIDMLALGFSIVLLSLIFSPLCDCWVICTFEKIPRFARCLASSLLGGALGLPTP